MLYDATTMHFAMLLLHVCCHFVATVLHRFRIAKYCCATIHVAGHNRNMSDSGQWRREQDIACCGSVRQSRMRKIVAQREYVQRGAKRDPGLRWDDGKGVLGSVDATRDIAAKTM
jgi:hypothetical protein